MATKYFNTYLENLEKQYQLARKAYTDAVEDLKAIEEGYKKKTSPKNLKNLSMSGRQAIEGSHLRERREVMNRLERIQMDFERATREIRGEVERAFNRLYDADESRVDLRAVELIKSGILSDTELKRMAERYRTEGNNTMFRLACNAAKGRNDIEMKTLASYANNPLPRRDLELFDNLASAYHMALRPREVSASNAIDARLHDMAYSQTLEMGRNIKVEDADSAGGMNESEE